ncbi:Protein RETICULATA-RELATED 4 [Ranunculus cassubicifolius]
MAITASFNPSTYSSPFSKLNHSRSSPSSPIFHHRITTVSTTFSLLKFVSNSDPTTVIVRSHGGTGNGNGSNAGGGAGGGGGNGGNGGGDETNGNGKELLLTLATLGKSMEAIPSDLTAAVESGQIPVSIVKKYFELEKSPLFKWLLQFGGFRERLLADDLFLAKISMECGVGIFTKTAAEYDKRKENFMKELDFVICDIVMAIVADFMLVWLPAPTVALRPPLSLGAGPIAKFFFNCPDNAFQIALGGTSYSLIQRLGAIARNGAKLFAVGTTASLVGTGVTNALIKARTAVDKSFEGDAESIPVVQTSVAYGVYMAISSNLRYQILAGVVEQRVLEPLLHQHKILLSALCFAVRTGNTYLGSLLWVDYARWVGIQ